MPGPFLKDKRLSIQRAFFYAGPQSLQAFKAPLRETAKI
jgi:hypothetical protein